MTDIFVSVTASIIFLIALFLSKSIFIGILALGFCLLLAFFLVKDHESIFFKFRHWFVGYFTHGYRGYIVILTIMAFIYLNPLIGFNSSLIFSFFVITYFFHYDVRSSFVMALIFLSTCPLLLIVKQDDLAEQAAILAYYFLWIGVIWEIFKNVKENGTFTFSKVISLKSKVESWIQRFSHILGHTRSNVKSLWDCRVTTLLAMTKGKITSHDLLLALAGGVVVMMVISLITVIINVYK